MGRPATLRKYCTNCHKEFFRNKKTRESYKVFGKRKYCSENCKGVVRCKADDHDWTKKDHLNDLPNMLHTVNLKCLHCNTKRSFTFDLRVRDPYDIDHRKTDGNDYVFTQVYNI